MRKLGAENAGRSRQYLNIGALNAGSALKRIGKDKSSIPRHSAFFRYLEEIRHFWAKTLGISGPQWMMVVALNELDQGEGVPVNAVSKMLHVDPSFVTTQSKLLEKKGFVRRKTSAEDARIVKMSLTDKTYKHLAALASQQEALNEFIFAEFDASQIAELTDKLGALKKRLAKACLKVVVDF